MDKKEFDNFSRTGATEEEYAALEAYYLTVQNLDKRELAAAWDKRDPFAWSMVLAGREILEQYGRLNDERNAKAAERHRADETAARLAKARNELEDTKSELERLRRETATRDALIDRMLSEMGAARTRNLMLAWLGESR